MGGGTIDYFKGRNRQGDYFCAWGQGVPSTSAKGGSVGMYCHAGANVTLLEMKAAMHVTAIPDGVMETPPVPGTAFIKTRGILVVVSATGPLGAVKTAVRQATKNAVAGGCA
jgi:hypothetical protein